MKIGFDLDSKYVACALDTEGCVSLGYQTKIKGCSLKNPYRVKFQPHNHIVNTHKGWLEEIQRFFNLGVLTKKSRVLLNRKDIFILSFGPNDCRKILPQLIPFLIIKRKQAELLLEFLQLRSRATRNVPYQPRVKMIQEEIRRLNGRKQVVDSIEDRLLT